MTWAPERPGGDAVPAALAAVGAVGALGHTDADYATATRALEAVAALGVRGGLPLATHLFNGMPPLLSRAPGPVGAAIAAAGRGDAVLEVIADGVHLDGGTVQLLFDTVGPDHVALVSDAMAASGLPDGAYTLGGLDVTVSGRAARLTGNGSLAGGVSTLLDQVRWLVRDLGIPLADAVRAASATPARALALPGVGSLAAGQRADVVVVDAGLDRPARAAPRRLALTAGSPTSGHRWPTGAGLPAARCGTGWPEVLVWRRHSWAPAGWQGPRGQTGWIRLSARPP